MHTALMVEYDSEEVFNICAVALSCLKVPFTGLTVSGLSSMLCKAARQKALNLKNELDSWLTVMKYEQGDITLLYQCKHITCTMSM